MHRLKRRKRTRSDLGVLFVRGFVDLVLEFLTGFLEFPHALAETAGEFRQLFRSEEEKDRQKDQYEFLVAKTKDGEGVVKCVHLISSVGLMGGLVKGEVLPFSGG